MRIIRVDIDDTIARTPNIDGVNRYDLSVPIKERIEFINRLHDAGDKIIYWTSRGNSTGVNQYDLTYNQLKEWGCKFDRLEMGKPNYDVFIDDKAFNSHSLFASLGIDN